MSLNELQHQVNYRVRLLEQLDLILHREALEIESLHGLVIKLQILGGYFVELCYEWIPEKAIDIDLESRCM